MTPIIFLAGYCIGIILTIFRKPIWGLYTYLFTFYMAPNSGWWQSEIPDLRYLLIIGLIAVAFSIRQSPDSDRPGWYRNGAAKLLIAFVCYNWIQIAWAIQPEVQTDGAILFSKHLIAFYLMYRFSDSQENLTRIALAHVIGCAWFGWQAFGAGGGRLESVGGAVAGANELGVHISTGLLFAGILLLSQRGLVRAVSVAATPLIANCLVLTVSRGAFLGFVGGGIAGFLLVPRKLRIAYVSAGVLALILFSLLAHDQLIERFSETIAAVTGDETAELDSSAAGRLDIAIAGVRMGIDHPLGVGHRGTAVLSPQYMAYELLSKDGGRAAHNTVAAVVAEHGLPGIIVYLGLIGWTFSRFRLLRRLRTQQHALVPLGSLLVGSLVAIYVSGNFSNNVDLETQYWCLGLLASLTHLVQREFNSQPDGRRSISVRNRISSAQALHRSR